MGIGETAKKLAGGAGVALATTGLSTCNNGGAVDPPPPPFECTPDVRVGQTLQVFQAVLTGLVLEVTIYTGAPARWAAAQVASVQGGVARPLALPAMGNPLLVVLDLADDTVRQGSFTLTGMLEGLDGVTCSFSRTFTVIVDSAGVRVTRADELPLPERAPARIALVSREGREVQLKATTAFPGPVTMAWMVSAGEILAKEGTQFRWRLPSEPGLYQAELIADYGPGGFSFDALVLEVS
jgi:hypothetical protein